MELFNRDITNDYTFGIRQPNEMDDSVLYAEPSIQGNNVIARRQTGDNETTINLELLFKETSKVFSGVLVVISAKSKEVILRRPFVVGL